MALFMSPLLLVTVVSFSSIAFLLHTHTDDRECIVSKEQAIAAMHRLYLVGDPDMINPKEESDIDRYCENAREMNKQLIEHLKCLNPGSARHVFGTFSKTVSRVIETRCSDKNFREGYLKYGECIHSNEAVNDIHQCSYKLHDIYEKALDNVDVDNLVQMSCCASLRVGGCVMQQIQLACNEEVVKFAPRLLFELTTEPMTIACPGIKSIDQCKKMYPKHMAEVDKIYDSTTKLSPRQFMVPGYQIHDRRGSRLPEFIEVNTN